MKIKNFILHNRLFTIIFYINILVIFLFIPLSKINAQRSYRVDTQNSRLKWKGSKISGEHNGLLSIKKGHLRLKKKNKRISLLTGTIIIDMNSISCSDIGNPKYNKKLVNHLKSSDFFDTKKHKIAKLKISGIRLKNKAKEQYIVLAKVTIRGISRKINFPATFQWSKNTLLAQGKFSLDRTQFNVKYNSGKFFQSLGDKLIHDKFHILFNIIIR